jgi:hypothetical protein
MADLGGRAFGAVLSGDSDPSPPSSPTSRCRAPCWPPSPAEDGAARRRPEAGRLSATFRQCSATGVGAVAGPVSGAGWADAVGSGDVRSEVRCAAVPDVGGVADRAG